MFNAVRAISKFLNYLTIFYLNLIRNRHRPNVKKVSTYSFYFENKHVSGTANDFELVES